MIIGDAHDQSTFAYQTGPHCCSPAPSLSHSPALVRASRLYLRVYKTADGRDSPGPDGELIIGSREFNHRNRLNTSWRWCRRSKEVDLRFRCLALSCVANDRHVAKKQDRFGDVSAVRR